MHIGLKKKKGTVPRATLACEEKSEIKKSASSLLLCCYLETEWLHLLHLSPAAPATITTNAVAAPTQTRAAPPPWAFRRNGSHGGTSRSSTTLNTSRGMPPPSIPTRKAKMVRSSSSF